MTLPPIIGLSGYARTGKDTVAEILVGHGYRRVAFADKIREALLLLNPSVDAHDALGRRATVAQVVSLIGWETAKDSVPEIRGLLQRLGSDMAHPMFGKDCWVRLGLAAVDGPTVFTDCRFPLEADAIRERGGQMWRVIRPGYGPVNGHVSEIALDGYLRWDRMLVNDRGLDELAAAVRHALDG